MHVRPGCESIALSTLLMATAWLGKRSNSDAIHVTPSDA